ncbi:MAG TPA: TIM44-like domain-containing protein [Acidimicrobiales bacterium]|nr:TIM44-like domain-containing protein [Acidimicrobiales bacterium]
MVGALATAAHILTRAGGGQGFGGGGGVSGGGGGFGGGGGGGFPLFFFGGGALARGGSILVVVVVLAVILLFVMSRTRRRTPLTDGGAAAHPYPHSDAPAYAPGTVPVVESGQRVVTPVAAQVSDGLAAITAHDPAFDVEAFKASVERCFFIVQQAWSEQKPEMSRRVMADGVWQQHRAQIEQYQHNGTRNMLDGLAVGKVTLIGASSDAQHDTITARILATCADYDVQVASGRVVRGDKHTMTPFQEDWVFQRSSSATTPTGGGTMEEHCPNCGAPLDLDLAGVCHYCRAPVMSGQYDWVLIRIDQV